MIAGGGEPAALLPHDGPARFVERVLEHDDERILCEARIPAESVFATVCGAPSYLGLELAAQASAVLEGLRAAAAGGRPERRLGYLVRARRLQWSEPWLPVATTLRVEVRREGIAGPLHLYVGEIRLDETTRFTGTFGTFTGIS